MSVSTRALAALAAAALVGTTLLAAAASGSQSRSLEGGTYRVGWESSFFNRTLPWTGGFDPTRRGRPAQLRHPLDCCCARSSATNHVAAPAGRVVVPDLAVERPRADERRPHGTRSRLKRGIRFGPPVNREIVAGDIRYAIERLARPRNGAPVPLTLLPRHPRLRRVPRTAARDIDRWHPRRAEPKTIVFEPPASRRRLPAQADAAATAPDAARGRPLLRRPARPLRPRSGLVRSIHGRGRRPGQVPAVQRDQANVRGLRAATMLVRNPRYDPQYRQPRRRARQS